MLITSIIARSLALVDAILAKFAVVALNPAQSQNICGTYWTVYDANLTTCGTSFVNDLVALITGLTRLAPNLMAGLFTT